MRMAHHSKLSFLHLHRHNLLQNANSRFYILHIFYQHTTTGILLTQIATAGIFHHISNDFTERLALIIRAIRIRNKEQ